MGLLGWTCLLLLAAPEVDEEGSRLLRVAYASQYEWKEDRVENASFDLAYVSETTASDGRVTKSEGHGHAVVAGGRIVRVHLPGKSAAWRAEILRHLEWVVGRFVRPPFEERFQDTPIAAPEELPSGAGVKVRAGEEEFVIAGERLTGENRGSGQARHRCDFTLADLRDGYVVAGEKETWSLRGGEETLTRELTLTDGAQGVPVPLAYRYVLERPGGPTVTMSLAFSAVELNKEHAVVLDPQARDRLKAAWEARYTLPDEVRVDAEFVRKPDPKVRGRAERLEGEFRLWGMDDLQVRVDDRRLRNAEQWRTSVTEAVQGDLRWLFDLVRARPFDEVFASCGFSGREDGGAWIVDVYGYPDALAFRIEDGHLAGHLDNVPEEDAWWRYKGRDRDGKFLLMSMDRTIDRSRFEQQIAYARIRGLYVPRSFTIFKTRGWNDNPAVDEYEFRKLRASLP